jgi:alpha-tubulin suppressor-like RCC1 family protein
LSNVIAISTGGNHALALTYDGQVWAWGYNVNGELGLGKGVNNTNPRVPTRSTIAYGVCAKAISAGSENSMVLQRDGTVWVCGYNKCGQLAAELSIIWSGLALWVYFPK